MHKITPDTNILYDNCLMKMVTNTSITSSDMFSNYQNLQKQTKQNTHLYLTD